MSKDKIRFRDLLGFFVLFIFAASILLLARQYIILKNQEGLLAKKKTLELLLEASNKLKKLWHEGDSKNVWKNGLVKFDVYLGTPETTDDSYLRCNPHFLELYFSQYKAFGKRQDAHFVIYSKKYRYLVFAKPVWFDRAVDGRSKRHYKIVTKSNSSRAIIPNYAVYVELYLPHNKEVTLPVLLEDSCHDVYLPQRVYGVGPYKLGGKKKDWTWDNFGRDIYIDKYLVTYRDIAEWIEYSNDLENQQLHELLPSTIEQFPRPATNLTVAQMRQFCAFKGKHLLEAHIFDAASFYPFDIDEPKALNVLRGPYPWTVRRKKFYLARPKKGEKNKLQKESVEISKICSKVYAKECFKEYKLKNFYTDSVTWTGIFQVMGGNFEYLRNPINSKNNLKASSHHFSYLNDWHQLGVRAFWDGLGHGVNNFHFQNGDTPSGQHQLGVGFRCMRFVAK
ncbi:MAG: hypothetical protein ISR65_06510 [Bacteriovoracaceae bacterium]|nr:hypothetical protein [Bacteriovoracaceae bacterium]